ncbi:MAG: hypothetical protein JWM80_5998 [Cyanobacteria bacterium RYN_339]|nr:hypothetical protein [Cyanobacteria bacterium RYN_339]
MAPLDRIDDRDLANRLVQRLAAAAGRPLVRVAASVYAGDQGIHDEPIAIWLYFAGLAPFRLFGSPEGWNLAVDDAPPEPYATEELGEILIRDVTRLTTFRAVQDQTLQAAWLVESSLDRGPVGVRLHFGAFVSPIVLNLGDHLYVSHRYPADPEIDETFSERSIAFE